MALADPELELLGELLAEDPADPAFLDVAREYVRRREWPEAIRVLVAATDAGADDPEAWSLLAIASYEATHYLRALTAIGRFGPAADESDVLSRIRVLAYERSGQTARARDAAVAHLARFPDDGVVREARERLERATPAPGGERRRPCADPLVTEERAEGFVAVGRIDRAIRLYRRLLHHDPGNARLEARLRALEGEDWVVEDDLSEELTAEMEIAPPPGLTMPAPGAATPAPIRRVEAPGTDASGREAARTAIGLPREGEPDYAASVAELAAEIHRRRTATGSGAPRSVVPADPAGGPVPSSDILRAAEAADADDLRDRIRQAQKRRARRRSLIRK